MLRPVKPRLTRLGIPTPDGIFIAGYSEQGLAELRFPSKQAPVPDQPAPAITSQLRRWHQSTASALKQTLAGHQAEDLPPLDWSAGTDFQQQVWGALKRIPAGKTLSYGEVAQAIGKPKTVRAVGGACGANPIPVLVPCHRVLAANRKLGGFSGGLEWKRILLAREGVAAT